MSAFWSFTCNPARQPCGCTAWDQFESGRWVRKWWLCNGHETAATEGGGVTDDELIEELAGMLVRIERNYERETSGPGSRFEGQRLEVVQARALLRRVLQASALWVCYCGQVAPHGTEFPHWDCQGGRPLGPDEVTAKAAATRTEA